MKLRKEVIGDCILYCADAREVLPLLSPVHALVTDPPYGVSGGSGTMGKASTKTKYEANFPDTPEYIETVCAPLIAYCLKMSTRGAVTTGTRNMFKYPEPVDIGGFTNPAGCGISFWGMVTYQPILFYGKDPRVGKSIGSLTHHMNSGAKGIDHPCPKPLKEWTWLVNKVSLPGEIVLDPFMGSGTTGVACANLGRKFIGIEMENKYFDVACRRIEQAYKQPDIFIASPDKAKQHKIMFGKESTKPVDTQ